VMGRLSHAQKVLLAVGHQRHYSVLYDNAVHLLRWGILGELHHIRAQWHRGNLPGRDSWQQALPGGEVTLNGKSKLDKIARELAKMEADLKSPLTSPKEAELLIKKIAQWRAWDQDKEVKAEDYGYESKKLSNGRPRPALEELCRWRLWDRTGGGLMAELGSHQLDAAGIFCSALRKDGKKAHPLTVHVVGGRQTFPLDRDCDDHVYCLFEFPAPGYDPEEFDVGYKDEAMKCPGSEIPGYDKDQQKKIVVMYSSINGNGFGGYGEVVMGTKGTLVLEREQQVMLYKSADTSSRVSVKNDKGGPTMNTQASGAAGPMAKAAESLGKVSRGYTEEIEHWAWCIRNPAPENQPHCKPEVALGDAVIALTTNFALKQSVTGKGTGFVKFDENWYELDKDETPDGSDLVKEYARLVKEA
jgi:predicted dehydrogenase